MATLLDHALLDYQNVFGVYGYLRELQQSLIKSCPFYARYKNTDLPLDIKNLCLLLYNIPMPIDIEINKQVSDWLDMDYDGGVQSIDHMYINTCLIGYKITNKMCYRCIMEFKWLQKSQVPIKKEDKLVIGFIDAEYHTKDVLLSGGELGLEDNMKLSNGIAIETYCNYFRFFVFFVNSIRSFI